MNAPGWRSTLQMPPDHPCLPGHFPGRSLVPGVWLLEQVALALQSWRGEHLARVVEAKFVAPLLPGQDAELTLAVHDGRVRFAISREGRTLARGLVEGAA